MAAPSRIDERDLQIRTVRRDDLPGEPMVFVADSVASMHG